MLFDSERLHFFRPLTGKYREQIAACLRELYARLYSSLADYSRVIGRDLVLEVFEEAITRSPVLDDADDDKSPPVRDEREQASPILREPGSLRPPRPEAGRRVSAVLGEIFQRLPVV